MILISSKDIFNLSASNGLACRIKPRLFDYYSEVGVILERIDIWKRFALLLGWESKDEATKMGVQRALVTVLLYKATEAERGEKGERKSKAVRDGKTASRDD